LIACGESVGALPNAVLTDGLKTTQQKLDDESLEWMLSTGNNRI